MAKAKLKIVERKTIVSREAISRAFAGVRSSTKSKNSLSAEADDLSPKTNIKKKPR